MRTPAGIDCLFFYGDYYRGKQVEECRLIGKNPPPQNWTPALCTTCPVPSIKRANACEYMVLIPVIRRKLGLFKRYVSIKAFCKKSNEQVKEPHIGCGICHPIDFKN